MKNLKIYLILSLFLVVCYSCQKEQLLITDSNSGANRSRVDSHYDYPDNSIYVKTEIGEVGQNPFSVDNLKAAIISLCGDTSGIEIRATDK